MMNANQILNLRNRLCLTQAAFASILGVGVASVSRWERGACQPRELLQRMMWLIADREIGGEVLRALLKIQEGKRS